MISRTCILGFTLGPSIMHLQLVLDTYRQDWEQAQMDGECLVEQSHQLGVAEAVMTNWPVSSLC
jgi:hypothetical protein